MRPFQRDEYMAGWDARIAGKNRSDNPYQRPFCGAWDSYRQSAWDHGWRACDAGSALPAWYQQWHRKDVKA
jgi:hypothetical protein